jgi:hypothetical protein
LECSREEAKEEGRVQVNVLTIRRETDIAAAVAVAAMLAPEKLEVPIRNRHERRAHRRRLTVAEVIHREHDGPDPAELPRRRRRMPFPPRSMFHTEARTRRAKRTG